MTDEEKLAEKTICSKCSDDVNRSYTNCTACLRCDDFINGYEAGKPKWHDLKRILMIYLRNVKMFYVCVTILVVNIVVLVILFIKLGFPIL